MSGGNVVFPPSLFLCTAARGKPSLSCTHTLTGDSCAAPSLWLQVTLMVVKGHRMMRTVEQGLRQKEGEALTQNSHFGQWPQEAKHLTTAGPRWDILAEGYSARHRLSCR